MRQLRPIRVFDFDSSVTKQQDLLRRFNPLIVDLLQLGPQTRLWMNTATAARLKELIATRLKQVITFLGSGDFHHVSSFLIGQLDEPVSVIVFDHHPDWDILPPKYGCGSWVSRILEMPHVRKVVLFGVASNDISFPGIQSANLAALKDSRLEIHTYAHHPTSVFFRNVPENVALQASRGLFSRKINWQELINRDLGDYFPEIINRLPTRKVYISIDKDCLVSRDSLTNWEEGSLHLDELLLLLGMIRDRLEIAGVDITGDYSLPYLEGKIKTICSRFDHPKNYTARGIPAETITAVNEKTNIGILEKLAG
jgi:hypothetical protein